MNLTGKCKMDFEEWFNEKYRIPHTISRFKGLPQTMQQGVLREFFESKGMIVEIFSQSSKPKLTYGYKVVQTEYDIFDDGFPDYSTAFTHAIDKACEIINGKEN